MRDVSSKDVEKVRSLFTDTTSQGIFEARLAYHQSGDFSALDGLVRHGSDKIKEKVALYGKTVYELQVNPEETVVFYGAGWIGLRHFQHFSQKCQVILCDQNHEAQSKKRQLPVISPQELWTNYSHCKVVVCCSNHSVAVYEMLMAQGISPNQLYLGSGADYVEQCFPPEFDLTFWEVFVDCGGFDGATSLQFAKHCPNYEKIFIFEPDAQNVATIEGTIKEHQLRSCEIIPHGLWNEATTLRFHTGREDVCGVSEEGDSSLEVVSLEDALGNQRVTFLKMDIEGAEEMALLGGKQLIQSQKPKLAISIYHKPEDILTLPLLIHSFVPDYQFFLRHYTGCDDDTILYAMVPENNQWESDCPHQKETLS